MKILITNDDGIWAPGLKPLVRWAKTLGQVTVAAPKVEQSGKSQGIELHKAFEVKKVDFEPGVEAYAIDSTPADCVRYMVLGRKESYDLVFSGINKGLNVGLDMLYSGTVGAIFEASCLGIPAIAFSTGKESFEAAEAYLDPVYDFLVKHQLMHKHSLYNINFPQKVKGLRITRQGGPFFSNDFPSIGDDLVMPTSKLLYEDSQNDDLDTDAVQHGYISITPLTIYRTAEPVFASLCHLNENDFE